MIDFEREELQRNPEWTRVLEAYRPVERAQPDDEGWIERVRSVEGIDDELLPRIHGRLIAMGLLKFHVAGRQQGVCYCLSTHGERVLNGGFTAANQSSDE